MLLSPRQFQFNLNKNSLPNYTQANVNLEELHFTWDLGFLKNM